MALVLCVSYGAVTVSAAENAEASERSLMPVNFSYSKSISVYTDWDFPPGQANFDVTITGVYDVDHENVMSINTKNYSYRGGVNCYDHDMELVVWKDSSDASVVHWQLKGNLSFQWTSPVTGIQYETVYLASPVYSFDAWDYT